MYGQFGGGKLDFWTSYVDVRYGSVIDFHRRCTIHCVMFVGVIG